MDKSTPIPEEVKKYVVFQDQRNAPVGGSDMLSENLLKSFNGEHKQVKLLAGLSLWRFCSSVNRYYFSDCWIDSPTMTEIMTSFRAVGIFTSKYKKELIRSNLAILYDWNKLDYRVKIELKEDMVAYIGTIGSQKVFIPAKANLLVKKGATVEKMVEHRIGGHTQYIIPGLARMPKENKFAKVQHFSPI